MASFFPLFFFISSLSFRKCLLLLNQKTSCTNIFESFYKMEFFNSSGFFDRTVQMFCVISESALLHMMEIYLLVQLYFAKG